MKLLPEKTALVLIDLQNGIVSRQTQPHAADEVVKASARLAEAFRAKGALVVAVNVDYLDGRDVLRPLTDQPPAAGGIAAPPQGWAQLVPEIERTKSIGITKRQWGAFHGTELDLQLRRRGIDTIVLGGISTNIGVETTAREAFQFGYQQVFASDAMAAMSAEEHEFPLKYIFPRIGRIRTADEIIKALQ